MRVFTHCIAALSLALLAVLPGAAGGAEPPRIPAALGDGAAGCAEAKSAFAVARARAVMSAASSNLDVTYYHLDLTPDLDASIVAGTVRVEGRVTGSPMSQLSLDLADSMIVSDVALGDGTPLAYSHSGAVLTITLPAVVNPGAIVTVDVTYSGIPIVDGFGNFVFATRSNGRVAWSLSEPYGAREWWPCKDHPSDKADSVRVTVTVPSQYRVGSQGLLESETVNGSMTTYEWVSRYPISNYLVSVAIGDYVRYTDSYTRPAPLVTLYGALSLPLEHLVYNDTSHDLPKGFKDVTDQLAVFEDWFGPYPFPNEKYGHAEFTFGGGMEHQTMSSMGFSSPGLVSHELAHQWYGDCISPKQWRHLWLNEGFATFAESIYWEAREDSFPGSAEAVRASRYASALRAQGTLVLSDTSSVSDMFNGNRVYAKGAVVLHMLREIVGDTTFRAILRAWAADPAVRYGVAETGDLQRVVETVSGMDFDTFFRQWVTDGTGYPVYRFSSYWKPEGAGYRVWVTVSQAQKPPDSNVAVFQMPLDIKVRTSVDSLNVTTRVLNDRQNQVFDFLVNARPKSVTLDPDHWILRGSVDPQSAAQVPSYPEILAVAPNPSRDAFVLRYTVDEAAGVTITVYDVRGRRVLSPPVSSSATGLRHESIDTSSLASGVYFLRVDSPLGRSMRKFMVLR